MALKAIAQREGMRVYILVEKGVERPGKGQILDLEQGELFPEFNFESLLARGYWDEVADEPTEQEIASARRRESASAGPRPSPPSAFLFEPSRFRPVGIPGHT